MPEEICCTLLYYAGCAFTKSYVGYVHAVAHSLGGQYNIPHGLANAILLPHVLKNTGNPFTKNLPNWQLPQELPKRNPRVQVFAFHR
ncbi:MAG: iron-containing alcohol dehydrogenase [Dorea sp.]